MKTDAPDTLKNLSYLILSTDAAVFGAIVNAHALVRSSAHLAFMAAGSWYLAWAMWREHVELTTAGNSTLGKESLDHGN